MLRRSILVLAFLPFAAPGAAQETPAVARIEITPARVEASPGDTVRLTAAAFDASGQRVETPVQWFTSYEVGTIDSTGAFVAFKAGTRAIIAVAGGTNASVPVTVVSLPPARVELGLPASLAATSWVPLDAAAYDRTGRRVFDQRYDWSSSNPGVAEVRGGYLVAKAPGAVTVTANAGGARGSAQVTVTGAPSGRLTATTPGAPIKAGDVHHLAPRLGGRALAAGAFPHYAVTGPAGATVYPDGAFVADDPGDYMVEVAFGGSRVEVPIRVEPRAYDKKLEFVGRGAVSYAHTGDLWVFQNAGYVGNYGDTALRVFDISDPANPVMTDSIVVDARRVNDIKVNEQGGFAIMTREGAASRRNGIVVLGIADPLHPTILSEYTETVTGGVHNTFIVGDLVYAVNDGTRDMHIIDVSDRRNPKEVGRWGLDNPNKTLHDVFIKDGIAYLSYWDDGLVILDLGGAGKGGTPTAPVFVSRVYYGEGNTHVSWRWKDYVFVGDEIFPNNWNPEKPIAASGYIHVFDVRDLEHPVEVAKFEIPEAGTHNVWIDDDDPTLYIGYYQAGLRTVDISGELRGELYRQGRQIDAYMTEADENVKVPNAAFNWGVMLHNGLIFSADFNSGLWIHRWVPTGDRPIS